MHAVVRKLFFDIAHCDIAMGILNSTLVDHPCHTIVLDQCAEYDDFQLPEPWVGHIASAPLLFVSSNPSIGKDTHARGRSNKRQIWDSHVRLFDADLGLTRNGIYPLDEDGRFRKSYVRHWAFVSSRARELLGRDVRPGIDYALTEVVHCKTRDERGVSECVTFCASRYLQRILDVAAARLVIAMGVHAAREIRRLFDLDAQQELAVVAGGRRIAFMPHSNFRGPRTFAAVMPEHFTKLKVFAQGWP